MPQNTPRGYTYPLFTDAQNFPAQMQDFATDVDTDVQAQLTLQTNYLDQPSARVSASASQTIASNTDVTLTWAVEEYDNAGLFTLVAPTIFTVNELGIYWITTHGFWNSNADSTTSGASMRIVSSVTGTRARHGIRRGIDSTPDTIQTPIGLMVLHEVATVGETISVVARHNLPVSTSISSRTFTITKISEDN